MRRAGGWLLLPMLLWGPGIQGCADPPAPPRSVSGGAGSAAGTDAAVPAMATDGSLVIDVTPALHGPLRIVADSFAVREAIEVVIGDGSAGTTPDLRIVAANEVRALHPDSLAWLLAFAVRDADSVASRAAADSTGIALFAVPTDATNGASAERFIRYVLEDARGVLPSLGLVPLVRREARGRGVPPSIAAILDTVIPWSAPARADSASPP